MTYVEHGEAVPAPHIGAAVVLAQLSHDQGHLVSTAAGRVALCAMSLAVVVRCAGKMPSGTAERQALARAVTELRRVV